ncbi:hypothetical protein [Streptomyces sp. NPDC017202]|uniref:hypothetical protein n=1 Tax=Streptomyces sp. NPDC017202 TaxID=3364981 RepID=UPI0037A8827D
MDDPLPADHADARVPEAVALGEVRRRAEGPPLGEGVDESDLVAAGDLPHEGGEMPVGAAHVVLPR